MSREKPSSAEWAAYYAEHPEVIVSSREQSGLPPLAPEFLSPATAPEPRPDVEQIMAYEAGEMNPQEQVEFFAGLIKSELAWQLQGHYGREAAQYIAQGWISEQGEINQDAVDADLAEFA
jgi:hypothetical protein